MGKQPSLYNCDYPTCDETELGEDDVTHFQVRVSSPANPGTEVLDFDLCGNHMDSLDKVLDDYRNQFMDTSLLQTTERPENLEREVCECGGNRLGFFYYEDRDMWVCYNCWRPVITNPEYVAECIGCGETFVLRIYNNNGGLGVCGNCK